MTSKGVENDTTFAWSSDVVEIKAPESFNIVQLSPMAGWTANATPVLPLDDGTWGATVEFSTGQGSWRPTDDWQTQAEQ